jgi:uncharacterized membrane protein YkvA (DUF1232 family)
VLKFVKNIFLIFWISALLLYIVSPVDFIPEMFFGLFGLIDDLIALIILLCFIGGAVILR